MAGNRVGHDEIEFEQYEVIEGNIYDMSPSPSSTHQMISGNIFLAFGTYLKGKPCKVFSAPFDVFMTEDSDEWVIPDISIVCDPSKIYDQGCVGAPDLTVEILSKSTAVKDRTVKLKLYRASGVQEYWIVDPNFNTVEVYNFNRNVFAPEIYGENDSIQVGIFDDLSIHLSDIF